MTSKNGAREPAARGAVGGAWTLSYRAESRANESRPAAGVALPREIILMSSPRCCRLASGSNPRGTHGAQGDPRGPIISNAPGQVKVVDRLLRVMEWKRSWDPLIMSVRA